MAFSGYKEAAETATEYRVALKITPNDADSLAPAALPSVFYLSDMETWSTQPIGGGVLDFGEIESSAEFGAGLGSISDVQITVANTALIQQDDNSAYTFPSGSGGMDPEPSGDERKAVELLQVFTLEGAAVEVIVYWADDGHFFKSLASLTSKTVFSGTVNEVESGDEAFVLDVTQDMGGIESEVGGRIITDPGSPGPRDQRAPIVYGSLTPDEGIWGLNDDLDQIGLYELGHKGPLALSIPFERESDGDFKLIHNDMDGLNDTYDDQAYWNTASGKSADTDRLLIYHPAFDGITEIITGTGTTRGTSVFLDATASGTTNDYLGIRVNKVQEGYCFVPCVEVFQDANGDPMNNPGNLFDRNPTTYASVSINSTGANDGDVLLFRLAPISAPPGEIILEADAITAWIALRPAGISATPDIRYGLYRNAGWVGTQAGAVYGPLTDTEINAGGLFLQKDDNSVDVPKTGYQGDSGATEPITQWKWFYNVDDAEAFIGLDLHDTDFANASIDDDLFIYGLGAVVKYRLSRLTTVVAYNSPAVVRNQAKPASGIPLRIPGRSEFRVSKPVIGTNLVQMDETTLDFASAPISGSSGTSMVNPAHQAGHVIQRWAEGVSASQVVKASSTFGSFHAAAGDLDDWLDDLETGEKWESIYIQPDSRRVSEVVGDMASQAPLMVNRRSDGDFYAVAYPNSSPSSSHHSRYKDDDGNAVKFHPEDPRSQIRGKPYGLHSMGVKRTGREEIYNRFRLNFSIWTPESSFQESFRITETNADGRVWDPNASVADPTLVFPNTLDISWNPADLCSDSQDRYNIKRELVIDAPNIKDYATATAFILYLCKRFTNPRMLVSATTGIEALDLQPGHIVQFDDTCNWWQPRIDYQNDPAKEGGWSDLDFAVKHVRMVPSSGDFRVQFTSEQIVYP